MLGESKGVVSRYKEYLDKVSYHSPPSFFRSIYTKFRAKVQNFEIGMNSKIFSNVDIRITEGGKLKIGSYVTIADNDSYSLLSQVPM